MKKLIKISIVEDNEFARKAYSDLVNDEKQFVLLGTYKSCELAFTQEDFLGSDVIIMDLNLPGMSGIEGIEQIRKTNSHANIIVNTINDDDENIYNALRAGAVGYLLKSETPERVIESIKEIVEGGSPMSPAIARRLLESFHQKYDVAEKYELTENELKVLKFLAEGDSYKQISEKVNLTVHGVKYHLRNTYSKLNVANKAEAVNKAHKFKLLIQNPFNKN